jgi:hypothetical protein
MELDSVKSTGDVGESTAYRKGDDDWVTREQTLIYMTLQGLLTGMVVCNLETNDEGCWKLLTRHF